MQLGTRVSFSAQGPREGSRGAEGPGGAVGGSHSDRAELLSPEPRTSAGPRFLRAPAVNTAGETG